MRGIEGMPFRYIALALAAVLVVGFVIEFTNTTTKGLNEISGDLIMRVKEAEMSHSDVKGPEIAALYTSPYSWKTCFEVKVKDESGVSFVSVRFYDRDVALEKEGTSGGWEYWSKCVENHNHGETSVSVLAVDGSMHRNHNVRTFTVKV